MGIMEDNTKTKNEWDRVNEARKPVGKEENNL